MIRSRGMRTWLEHVRVWDGLAEGLRPRVARIGIVGGAIETVEDQPEGSASSRPSNPLAEEDRIELRGCTAIPGLIDAHVHLTLDPAIRLPVDQLAVEPATLEGAMEVRAGEMLAAGITTARDLGGGRWQELALAARIEAGEVAGPRLLCAGQPVTSKGGHCHFWGGEVSGPPEIREVVGRQVDHGAHWIKVMATGGVITRGTQPMRPQFSQFELETVVREAASRDRHVAAHCHGTAGIRSAAYAGVRTIEHCSFAGAAGFGSDFQPGVVEALASASAWVSPTINAGWARFLEHEGRPSAFLERMRRCLSTLVRAGVPLVASTDAGIPGVAHHKLPQALQVVPAFTGLRPVEVLRSATSSCADALSLADCGRLLPGMRADLLVLEGDPLDDLSALERARLVVSRGRVFAGAALRSLRDRRGDAAPAASNSPSRSGESLRR